VSGVEEITILTLIVALNISETGNNNNNELLEYSPDIPILGATTYDNHLGSNDVVTALALQIEECTWLLGTTLKDITVDSPGRNPDQMLDAMSRAQGL